MAVQQLQATAAASTTFDKPREPGMFATLFSLWGKRHLIWIMVFRDLIGRYRGSLMGAFWPVINPLGHLLLYTFVFSIILHVQFTKNASTGSFALYFMTGMIPWGAFSEALSRSTTIILESPNLVKRVVFPIEVLPLVLVISGVLSQAIAAGVLLAMQLIINHALHFKLLLLPLVVLPQAMFTAGMCWFLASLSVYIRDLRHVIALVLSAWMFTTPIVYPASALPHNLQFMLWLNPLAGIVTDYRRLILENHLPDPNAYAAYGCIGLIVCLLGFAFFHRTKKSFADIM